MGADAGAVCSGPARSSQATSRPSASAVRSTCRVSTSIPARAASNSLALAKLTSAAVNPTRRVVAGDSEVSCRPRAPVARTASPAAGGAVVVGAFEGQRSQQRGEGLRAAAGVARRLAAGARYRRTRMVGIVRVEVLRHRLRSDAEGLATEGVLDGLEVLRGGSPRSDERIDFSRDRGYERCPPTTLTTWLAVARARR